MDRILDAETPLYTTILTNINLCLAYFLNYFMLIINESLFDMVPMDVLHACHFLDIIHLCLKHDF
jgi:hypothetical protein